MGLFSGITSEIKERLKEEMLNYFKKISEEQEKSKKSGSEEKKETEAKDVKENVVEDEKAESESPAEKKKSTRKKDVAEEWIPPVNEKPIQKLSINKKEDDIVISKIFSGDLQILSIEEFSVYMKLYFFSYGQKKNFGYLGNTLKKKLKMSGPELEIFDATVDKLVKRGLFETENVSATQATYTLYMPFEEDKMQIVEEKIEKKNEVVKNSTPVGKATADMDDDALMKSYRTFVSLEIDKAKMRVGRSSFDKIYMEAVKYIDKKYGFKVLSDSEKLKECLTDYYISAFDIPTFEEWKKRGKN